MRTIIIKVLGGIFLALWVSPSGLVASPMEVDDCNQCHGPEGVSTDPEVPRIAGLSEFYLDETLRQYADEYRPCPEYTYPEGTARAGETETMCEEAQELSEDQIKELAAHYSAMDFVPAEQEYDTSLVEHGRQVHEFLCEKCHADAGTDTWDDAGILAGQWTPYLRNSMQEFLSGDRPPSEKMQAKLDELNEGDVEALLAYWAAEGNARR